MDWTAFATSQQHSANTLPRLHNNQGSLARMLDPATVTYTGTAVTGAKRVNTSAAGGRFQMFNGTVWADQAINGLTFDGSTASFGALPVATTGTVSAAALVPTSSAVPLAGVYRPSGNDVGIAAGGSPRMLFGSGGDVTQVSGTFIVGQGLASHGVIVNGVGSGGTGGSAFISQLAGSYCTAMGNRSNLIGGGFSADPWVMGNGSLTLAVSGAGQLFLAGLGNAGLGTTTFVYSAAGRGLLEINGSSSALLALKTSDSARAYLFATPTGTELASNLTPFSVTVNGSVRTVFENDGTVRPGADQAQNFGTGSAGWLSVFSNSLVRASAGDLQVSAANASGNVVLRANGIDGLRVLATGASQFNRRAFTATATVAFAAALTIDATTSNYVEVGTLTANVTSLTLSNPVGGHALTIRFVQDATGGRTVALPSGAKVNGTQQTGANRVAFLNLVYSTAGARWEGAWSEVPA